MEASRLKSQFLSDTSHEIRTPNDRHRGHERAPARHRAGFDSAEVCRGCRAGCAALLAVVSEILDFSKIEAGRMQLDLSDVELRPLLEETTGALVAVAGDKGLAPTRDMLRA